MWERGNIFLLHHLALSPAHGFILALCYGDGSNSGGGGGGGSGVDPFSPSQSNLRATEKQN